MASRASGPPASSGSSSRKSSSVLDALQERHHLRMRPDRVRDVQQRQPHLRGHVVRDRLGQRVGRVLLAQPFLQVLVEPPGRLHRGHDRLRLRGSNRIRLQLLDVRQDEVEQRRPGLRLDVALQRRRRRPRLRSISSVTMAGSVSIGVGSPAVPARRAGGRELRPGATRMKSPRSRTVCSASPISGSDLPEHVEQARAARGRRQRRGDIDEQPARRPRPSGRGVVSCHNDSPSGFMASVIICW